MAIAKQLSVFLENKPGVLGRLCKSFKDNKININALSVSDTVDHAVVRLIVSDPSRARDLLEQHGVLVVETDVLSLELPDQPGILAQIANKLAKAKINIEYAYGTAGGSNTHPTLIVRVSDTKRAAKLLKKL